MTGYGEAPRDLMLAIRDEFSVTCFLETGTHEGTTASWAARHFDEVVTIEASSELHQRALETFSSLDNVRFVCGDSRLVIAGELAALRPAIVWLDGHWSGEATYGEHAECPLISEIEAIRGSKESHYVFIDDARLFLAPPPRPHNTEQWPTLTQVVSALTSGDRPLDVIVHQDAFVAVPSHAGPFVRSYARDAAVQTPGEPPLPSRLMRRLIRRD